MPIYRVAANDLDFYIVLDGREYCQSRTFDAGDKQFLLKIMSMLRELKLFIVNI